LVTQNHNICSIIGIAKRSVHFPSFVNLNRSFVRKGWNNLNKELLTKALTSLGLTGIDAEIYLLLAKEGLHPGRNIAEALKLYKQQLYRSLKRLQRKGIVSASLERPAQFSAASPEKILGFLIAAKKEQALVLQESREELLSSWRAITKKEFADN
jgi:sugar-specific transcriptional regulator TrmB